MAAKSQVVVAFAGETLLLRGELDEVSRVCRSHALAEDGCRIAVYDDKNGHVVDIDYSEGVGEIPPPTPAKRGRPKLGTVSREITLLPKHWQWLAEQPTSASATIRGLIDHATAHPTEAMQNRKRAESVHRFIWDIAGDQTGFEEATRALFAYDFELFRELTASWPIAIQEQIDRLLDMNKNA